MLCVAPPPDQQQQLIDDLGAQLDTLQAQLERERAAVIHADETGLRVGGSCHYVHVASIPRLTHYGYDTQRGRTAISEINIPRRRRCRRWITYRLDHLWPLP